MTKTLNIIAFFLLLGFFFFPENISAQKRKFYDSKGGESSFYGDKFRDEPLYKWQGFYRRTGLHFSLGPSFTATRVNNQTESFTAQDTSFQTTLDPSTRLGYYVKVGALHIFKFKRKFFQYIDYGVGLKQISGGESIQQELFVGDVLANSFQSEGRFGLGHLFFDFNINSLIQISRWNFIQNSLGFNVDYRIYQTGTDTYQSVYSSGITNQENIVAQLHYKLGVGIKLQDGIFLIPAIETPILTAYGWDGGRPMTRWFDSRYQPVYLTLKFAFLLKKNPEDCPPVFGPESDKWRQEQHQQGGGR